MLVWKTCIHPEICLKDSLFLSSNMNLLPLSSEHGNCSPFLISSSPILPYPNLLHQQVLQCLPAKYPSNLSTSFLHLHPVQAAIISHLGNLGNFQTKFSYTQFFSSAPIYPSLRLLFSLIFIVKLIPQMHHSTYLGVAACEAPFLPGTPSVQA